MLSNFLTYWRNLFLTNTFFWWWAGLIALFVLSFVWSFLFPVALAAFTILLALAIGDIWVLIRRGRPFEISRILPTVFSLGDDNEVLLLIQNKRAQSFNLEWIDEVPVEFQLRDPAQKVQIGPKEEKQIRYQLHPTTRGAYQFGDIHIFIRGPLGFFSLRQTIPSMAEIPVYPSIQQMKQYALHTFDQLSHQQGIKKIRRIGHSYEFEQIKNYVRGDDYRSINWKATGRRGNLMVNQYEDERSQQVYCVIDKSRIMKMPFDGLSLMDYAINTTLVMSNIALQKHDKAGLITFSDKIGTSLKADRRAGQLNKILQSLYREQEGKLEANYELLYQAIRRMISGRSLLILFTNFESVYGLERVLPILRRLNAVHLLVVVFFENAEIKLLSQKSVSGIEDIYQQTIARKFLSEKEQLVQKLQQYGIQTILTAPEDLSINTINKYLELKSRRMI